MERFHQTLKRWLAKQPRPATLAELQAQLDHFGAYYNKVRPHRAPGRCTPGGGLRRPHQGSAEAGAGHRRAPPPGAPGPHRHGGAGDPALPLEAAPHRHRRAHAGARVLLLVNDLDVRVITEDGELLRHLTLDPTKDYQGHERT